MADMAELLADRSAGAQNPAETRMTARSAVVAELRRLLPGVDDIRKPLPFGLPALDSHLPRGGLARGALHEIVPATETALPSAFGFVAALLTNMLAKLSRGPLLFILPGYTRLVSAHLSGHGLNSLGLDPAPPDSGRDARIARTACGPWRKPCVRARRPPSRPRSTSSISRPAKGCNSPPMTAACRSCSCGRRGRWKPAPPRRAGASARRRGRARPLRASRLPALASAARTLPQRTSG